MTFNPQTIYVAGFLFNPTATKVALVVKRKPKWQEGKMNAIGGKVEPKELIHEAQVREFEEETGLHVPAWTEFATLEGNDQFHFEYWKVHFFYSWAIDSDLKKLKTVTTEEIIVKPVKSILPEEVLPNVNWLIPMARMMFMGHDKAQIYWIQEK